jgi:hypothetical protein
MLSPLEAFEAAAPKFDKPLDDDHLQQRLASMREIHEVGDSGMCAVGTSIRQLTGEDPEPDTYAIVKLRHGWWALRNLRTGVDIVQAHGMGAQEDITDRWNKKTAGWLAWKERNS